MLAHIGGVPLEESLIYLVPPLAVVGWIWVLGRRARRDPTPPEDLRDDEADEADIPVGDRAPGGGRR